MLYYFNNEFLPAQDIRISPNDRGFLFGDGAYEVIRSYNGNLFCLDEHLERLAKSLTKLEIIVPDLNNLENIINRIAGENHASDMDALIYIQVTRGSYSQRTLLPFSKEIVPTIFVCSSLYEPPFKEMEDGIKIITEEDIRWSRCDIKSISLAGNVLGTLKASQVGAKETIWVRNGYITEGTHTNIMAVKNGMVYTPPLSNFILDGITRRTVLKICENLGIKYFEKNIKESELISFDEMMLTATSLEITPVIQVNDWFVNDTLMGGIVGKLQENFKKLTKNPK